MGQNGIVRGAVVMVWTCLGLVCMGVSCETPEAGFELPADAIEVSGPLGIPVIETRYENPILTGFVPLDLAGTRVEREDPTSLLFSEREAYVGPRTVRVGASGRGFSAAWLDVPAGRSRLDFLFRFVGQGVSLPMGGDPVFVMLESALADESAPEGEIREVIDQRFFRLDATVLVVPVHATVFARADGSLPYLGGSELTAAGIVSQSIDPAGSREGPYLFGRVSRPGTFTVVTHSFHQFEAAPDGIWEQCGIQFHLEDVEIVRQSDGLERNLVGAFEPCSPLLRGPLSEYLGRATAAGGVPLFVGGEIAHALSSEDLGISCPPGSAFEYVAVQGGDMLAAGVLAHELGHFIGLDHRFVDDNVMDTPVAATRSIPGRELTAEQCETARCGAASLLLDLELLERSRYESECGITPAVCGNGTVEQGEVCDDGNREGGDGCRADCTSEHCGDGVLDATEQCDYLIVEGREDCTAECMMCSGCNPCGDGVVGPGEQCDDGNRDETDGCDNACAWSLI